MSTPRGGLTSDELVEQETSLLRRRGGRQPRRAGPVRARRGAGLPDVIEALRPAVVQVSALTGGSIQRQGTGVWIDRSGLVLTALHVLRQAQRAAGTQQPDDVSAIRIGLATERTEYARGNFVHLPVEVPTVDD